jgi:hypothetical protein
VNQVQRLPGPGEWTVRFWGSPSPGKTGNRDVYFRDSDFDSDDERQLLKEFVSEVRRASGRPQGRWFHHSTEERGVKLPASRKARIRFLTVFVRLNLLLLLQ